MPDTEPNSQNTNTMGGKKLLRLHRYKKQYRGFSGTSDKDTTMEFLFTLSPLEAQKNSTSLETFWCEVQLKQSLASRAGWKDLGKADIAKALYCFAVDAIRHSGGRAARHLTVDWIPGAPYAEGPSWDLAKIDLKKTEPVVIDPDEGIRPVVVFQH
jgi:hypothetical protein